METIIVPEVKEAKCEIRISIRPSLFGEKPQICCEQWWTGIELDRPHTSSICFLNTRENMKVALAYQDAVGKGLIYSNPHLTYDNAGKSYITSSGFVMGKYLKQDLKKLGYNL